MKQLPRIDLEEMLNEDSLYSDNLLDGFARCQSDEYNYINDFNKTGWIGMFNLDLVLSRGLQLGASDIHVTANQQVSYTVLGEIIKTTEFVIPDTDIMEDLVLGVLNHQAQSVYVKEFEWDASYVINYGPYKGRRFRLSVGKSFENHFMVFRTITDNIPSKQDLGIEEEIESWFDNSSGAILVCGPTGSGKAIHKDEFCITVNGINKVGEVKVGDKLYDKDKNVCIVLEIHQAEREDKFYELTFSNGEKVKCSGRHDWLVYNDKGILVKVDTNYIKENFSDTKFLIPRLYKGLEFFNNLSRNKREIIFNEIYNNYKTNNDEVKIDDLEDYDLFVIYGNSLGYYIKELGNNRVLIQKESKVKGLVIDSIEEVEDNYEDYYCFTVDSTSHSYIVGKGFIVTHNSTTMAAILRDIQLNERKKIITIEKPIEAVFPSDGKSLVVQRAVPEDCRSFDAGLTSALRQNPDFILIGEVRNQLEVNEFLRAAETGHLAMSTIHTVNNVTTLNRIRSLFSGEEQKRILSTLGDVLRGIVNQALVKTKDGKSRFAVREILTIDYKIRKLIAEDRFSEIRDLQEANEETMEHKLAKAYLEGKCELKEARSKAPDQIYFDEILNNYLSETKEDY